MPGSVPLGGDPAAVSPDDPSPVSQIDRMRDAFAQLIARGRGQAAPMDQLMQAQAMQQGLKAPPQPMGPGGMNFQGNAQTPMPQAVPKGPQMNFPVAPAGPQMNAQFQPPAGGMKEQPFHGKGQYSVPKKVKPTKEKARG